MLFSRHSGRSTLTVVLKGKTLSNLLKKGAFGLCELVPTGDLSAYRLEEFESFCIERKGPR